MSFVLMVGRAGDTEQILSVTAEHCYTHEQAGVGFLALAYDGEPSQDVVRALANLKRALAGEPAPPVVDGAAIVAALPQLLAGIPLQQAHDLIADVQAGRAVLVRPSRDDRTRCHVIARTGTKDAGTEGERPIVTMRETAEQHAGLVARQAFEAFGRASS